MRRPSVLLAVAGTALAAAGCGGDGEHSVTSRKLQTRPTIAPSTRWGQESPTASAQTSTRRFSPPKRDLPPQPVADQRDERERRPGHAAKGRFVNRHQAPIRERLAVTAMAIEQHQHPLRLAEREYSLLDARAVDWVDHPDAAPNGQRLGGGSIEPGSAAIQPKPRSVSSHGAAGLESRSPPPERQAAFPAPLGSDPEPSRRVYPRTGIPHDGEVESPGAALTLSSTAPASATIAFIPKKAQVPNSP